MDAQLSSVTNAPGDVLAALRTASVKTGSDFSYLLSTAMRESGLNSQAKAKGSSATGLFQFIDSTWLNLVKRYGDRYGLGDYAKAIREDANGRCTAQSEQAKQAILALRTDPQISALMAGEAAEQTRQSLQDALGREVSGGDLYAAHFLGEGGAKRLLALADSKPGTIAAQEFPDAARANKGVFYHSDGSPKTVREVYDWACDMPDAPAGAASVAVASTKPSGALGLRTDPAAAPPAVTQVASANSDNEVATVLRGSTAALPRSALSTDQINSNAANKVASLSQRPLQLSPQVLEILAALPLDIEFRKEQ